MKIAMRYLAALFAVLALLVAAASGLVCCITTGTFAREVNGTASLRAMQQSRIAAAAAALEADWQLAPGLLEPYVRDAAETQSAAVAGWWQDLWWDAEASADMPAFLDAAQERELIALLLQDEGFRAVTDDAQRRAIARDEVAYGLDEAVCDAVTPLRRSIVGMGISLAMERVSLPLVRKLLLLCTAALAALGLALLAAAHRLAGSAMVATGIVMGLCAVPVRLLDVPGMLAQLSPLAAEQGGNALICLGVLWLGTAAALLLAGLIVIRVKTGKGAGHA